MSKDPLTVDNFTPADPIGDRVAERAATFIQDRLETYQKSNVCFGTDVAVSTSNSTEAILRYLDKTYKSFSANEDLSYIEMNMRDTEHFVTNLDQAYKEISKSSSNVQSFNQTLADFLTGDQLAVMPSKAMLGYYTTKNFVTNGYFAARGFSNAAVAKTLPVAARGQYLMSGANLLGTSFILSSAFSILEDLVPVRGVKIAFNSLKWVSILPAKGAEVVINTVLGPFEIMAYGIKLPTNGTKALNSGPGLTINDLSIKEVKKALSIALKKLSEAE